MTTSQPVTAFGSSLYEFVEASKELAKFTCMASLRVPDKPEEQESTDDERAPVFVVAVVDKSGSMSGDKMTSLKETLGFVINELGPRDRLAIVEYDSNVATSLPPAYMDQAGKDRALAIRDALHPGSCTNLSGGLLEGLRLIPEEIEGNTVVSTLLLTDGLANEGLTTSSQIIDMVRKMQSAEGYVNTNTPGPSFGYGSNLFSRGYQTITQAVGLSTPEPESTSSQNSGENIRGGRCTINTFGFGSDHDAAMLKALAQSSEGMYYYIENTDAIASAFADCLGGLLSVRAQGVEITIEALNDTTLGQVFTSKAVTTVEAGKKVRIDLGDIQDGEERDVPFEINLPSVTACGDYNAIRISVSFFDVNTEDMVTLDETITIKRPETVEGANPPNLLVDRNCNRIKGADAISKALEFAQRGQFEEARKDLQATMEEIRKSPSSTEEFCVQLLAQMEASLDGLKDRQSYQSRGQYQMNNCSHMMYEQRAAYSSSAAEAECDSAKPQLFSTNKRKMMAKKFA